MARIIAIISTPVLIHLISVDCVPAVANSLISNRANHQLSGFFPPLFFLFFFSLHPRHGARAAFDEFYKSGQKAKESSRLFLFPSFCPSLTVHRVPLSVLHSCLFPYLTLSVLLFIPSCPAFFLHFSCPSRPCALPSFPLLILVSLFLYLLSLFYILILLSPRLSVTPFIPHLGSLSFKCGSSLVPSSPSRPLKDNYSSSE